MYTRRRGPILADIRIFQIAPPNSQSTLSQMTQTERFVCLFVCRSELGPERFYWLTFWSKMRKIRDYRMSTKDRSGLLTNDDGYGRDKLSETLRIQSGR